MWMQLDVTRDIVVAAIWSQAKEGVPDVPASDFLGTPSAVTKGVTVHFEVKDVKLTRLLATDRDVVRSDGTVIKMPASRLGIVARVHATLRGLPKELSIGDADVTFRADGAKDESGSWVVRSIFEDIAFIGTVQNVVLDKAGVEKHAREKLEGKTFDTAIALSKLYTALNLDADEHPLLNLAVTPRGWGKGEPGRVSVVFDLAPITTPVALAHDIWAVMLDPIFTSAGDLEGANGAISFWYDAFNVVLPALIKRTVKDANKKLPGGLSVSLTSEPSIHWRTKGASNFVFDGVRGSVAMHVSADGDGIGSGRAYYDFDIHATGSGLAIDGKVTLKDFEGDSWLVDFAIAVGSLLAPDGITVPVHRAVGFDTEFNIGSTTFIATPQDLDVLLFSDHFRDKNEKFTKVVPAEDSILPLQPQPVCVTVRVAVVPKPDSTAKVMTQKTLKPPVLTEAGRTRHR